MKWLYKLFNHDKIDDLNRNLDIYKERNEQLEKEVREYKGYKLKYEVTKLYVDDDEGLLELFDLAKNRDEYLSNTAQQAGMIQASLGGAFGSSYQQSGLAALGQAGAFGALIGQHGANGRFL